jgi:hypothetical protein
VRFCRPWWGQSIKRELKIRCIYECRCDEAPQTKTKNLRVSNLSFICNRKKKRRKPRVKIVTLKVCGVRKSRYRLYEKQPTWVSQANHRGVNTREGAKSGVVRLEHMKLGRDTKGREDKLSGIEIRMTDALAKINPTDPLILA